MLTARAIQKVSVHVQQEVIEDVTAPFFSDLSLPAHVAKLAREFFAAEGPPAVLVFLFDHAQRLLAFAEVPREVEAPRILAREAFRAAVAHGACAVAFAHNHADERIAPDAGDHEATRIACHAGEVLGIRVLDHVVVASGTEEYYSFRQMGTLPEFGRVREI